MARQRSSPTNKHTPPRTKPYAHTVRSGPKKARAVLKSAKESVYIHHIQGVTNADNNPSQNISFMPINKSPPFAKEPLDSPLRLIRLCSRRLQVPLTVTAFQATQKVQKVKIGRMVTLSSPNLWKLTPSKSFPYFLEMTRSDAFLRV